MKYFPSIKGLTKNLKSDFYLFYTTYKILERERERKNEICVFYFYFRPSSKINQICSYILILFTTII